MKPVLLLLFIFAFSVLAQQPLITKPPTTTFDINRVSSVLLPTLEPSQPESHPSPQSFHWKKYWVNHTAIAQFRIGHLVTCHNDDSSESPIHTYSTRTKSSGKKKH